MVIILNLEALSYLEFLSGYEGTVLIQIRSLPKVADQAVFRPNMHLYPHIRIREEYSKSSYCSIVLEYSVLKFLIIEFSASPRIQYKSLHHACARICARSARALRASISNNYAWPRTPRRLARGERPWGVHVLP